MGNRIKITIPQILKSNSMFRFMTIFFLSIILFLACDRNDDPTPVDLPNVEINSLSIEEGEDNRPVYLTVRLDKASAESQVVIVKTVDGTAEAGSDYRELDNFPIEFLPGDVQNNLKIDLYGDDVYEEDETFFVEVVSPVKDGEEPARGWVEILNDDRDTSLVIPLTGYTSPTEYSGMEMIWSDEFDEGNNIENNWTFETGGNWHNNEIQYYRKENTHIHQGGYLVIEARNERYVNRNHTSSRIVTKDKFEFRYGRVDIRAVMPYGQGIWPALWMLGHNISEVSWPACGEIDIMELIGHQPATVYGTAHWSNAGQHAQYGGSKTLSSGIFNDEFHVFSIIWDEQRIEWYLDGVKYHSLDITPAELSEFHQDFFFIFNVAVGGNWPGNPDHTTEFPQRMIVDYIRVFQ
jgi:hypothetical protein